VSPKPTETTLNSEEPAKTRRHTMSRPTRRKQLLRSLFVLLVVLFATMGPSGVGPARAIPPLFLCDSDADVGDFYYEYVAPDTSDYIIWECKKTLYFGYWWQIAAIRNLEEDAKSFSEEWRKWLQEEVWQGLVDVGLARIDRDGNPSNDNLDSVVSFQLHGPSGSPIFRRLGTRIIVGYSGSSSGPFSACSDTGWKTTSSQVSAFSIKLQYGNGGKCGTGYYRLQGAGEFLSASTGQWVKTGWVYSAPIYMVGGQ
jgi:hypothetical protein